MAAHRLGFTRVPAAYGDPAADEALTVDAAAGREAPANRMHDYLAARTAFFDRTVVAAIGQGIRQVVVRARFQASVAAKSARRRSAGLLMAGAGPRGPKKPGSPGKSESPPEVGSLQNSSGPSRPSNRQKAQEYQQPQGSPSLSALLSQALVAFTIEFDNEGEHRIPHRTTNHGAAPHGDGAWLVAVAGQLDPGLPDCLPILGVGMLSRGPDPALPPRPDQVDVAALPLPALLARVLLSFALDYERESESSLAVSANLLRVLDAEGARLRDLPVLTGISKEAVGWALGILTRGRLAVEEPDPSASRGKVARLTARGRDAQRVYQEFLITIEDRWRERFGDQAISSLRSALEPLALGSGGNPPPLVGGLEPYPDNWRASVKPPATLPCYPMVLHRGGYPDGS